MLNHILLWGDNMKVYIHNEETNRIEHYNLALDQDMPYTSNRILTVGMFKGGTNTDIMWSSKSFLEAYNKIAVQFGCPIEIEHGFSRGWQEIPDEIYTHKLGTALNVGGNLSIPSLKNLVKLLEESGLFDYVSELEHFANFVHFHQIPEPDGALVPFHQIQLGEIGPAVFVLQDSLWKLGYNICELNGNFDEALNQEVKLFQLTQGLIPNGIVDRYFWVALFLLVHPEDYRLLADNSFN